MCSFEVGQVVVCVNAGNWSPDYMRLCRPKADGVYTIREVYLGAENAPSVLLCEVVNQTREHMTVDGIGITEPGFRASRFRPATTTRIDALEKLLAPMPGQRERRRVFAVRPSE
jgi:hypothetical protein